jgi:hypothetical protein
MKRRYFLLLVLLCGAGIAFAQSPAILSESEQLRQENLRLQDTITTLLQQNTVCEKQLLKQRIQAAHPGFVYDTTNGTLIAEKPPAK